MPDETATPDPDAGVKAELDRYGAELLPGAAADLAHLLGPSVRNLSKDKMAEEVARRLDAPALQRYKDPEHRKPEGQAPVRQVLQRHEGELREGSVDQLTKEWGKDLNGLPPRRIAGEVARRLATREVGERHLKAAPAVPQREMDLAHLIGEHFGPELKTPWSAAQMAREWADIRPGQGEASQATAIAIVATRLRMGNVAAKYLASGQPLAMDDRRATARRGGSLAPAPAGPRLHPDTPRGTAQNNGQAATPTAKPTTTGGLCRF